MAQGEPPPKQGRHVATFQASRALWPRIPVTLRADWWGGTTLSLKQDLAVQLTSLSWGTQAEVRGHGAHDTPAQGLAM